jgi:hypothetical protein
MEFCHSLFSCSSAKLIPEAFKDSSERQEQKNVPPITKKRKKNEQFKNRTNPHVISSKSFLFCLLKAKKFR